MATINSTLLHPLQCDYEKKLTTNEAIHMALSLCYLNTISIGSFHLSKTFCSTKSCRAKSTYTSSEHDSYKAEEGKLTVYLKGGGKWQQFRHSPFTNMLRCSPIGGTRYSEYPVYVGAIGSHALISDGPYVARA